MTLQAVNGGWINTDFAVESKTMITQERKSKYKHKITMPPNWDNGHDEMVDWCNRSFGPGGRSRRLRWRYGWTEKANTFYFKSSKDAMMFTLRWSS